ncbi:MAG: DUF4838 domain-containing protein [Clostridia bacterium]|nr:DUF4838 domain-containing protein [Clostridia bacterium]
MDIISDGAVKAGIILPQNPTMREEFAANELINYIKKICGKEITKDKNAENLIIIGGPARNAYARKLITEKDFSQLFTGSEGFIILSKGNMLLIAGSEGNSGEMERGTLYGVYEFLERNLGCSFAGYGRSGIDMGEHIPKCDNITVSEGEYLSKGADVEYRTAIVQYSNWAGNPDHRLNFDFIDWLAKNKYNRILTWASVYEGFKENGVLDEAKKRGICFSVGHHEATNLFLPQEGNKYFEEKYYETHPEYYKLTKSGERFKTREGHYDGQLILCMHNEECIKEFAKNIVKWLEKNPYVDIISIWPNDGMDSACSCELCRTHSKNSGYTYFVNEVAKLVKQSFPNVKIDRIVYNDLTECDKNLKCNSSMVIDEAVWQGELRYIGDAQGKGIIDTRFEENLLKWISKGAKGVYYDYYMGAYGCCQRYMPAADEIQAICKRFAEKGIYGLGTQMEVFNVWNNIFNFYTYGRTAYNSELTMEDNMERFCRIFGKGGEAIKKIIRHCEAVVDGTKRIDEAGIQLIEECDKNLVYTLYESALESAKTPCERNNIRMMRMAFRYSDLEVTNRIADLAEINVSKSKDENGELWYISKKFDSFKSGKAGFGIALPVLENEKGYKPDKWYVFDV